MIKLRRWKFRVSKSKTDLSPRRKTKFMFFCNRNSIGFKIRNNYCDRLPKHCNLSFLYQNHRFLRYSLYAKKCSLSVKDLSHTESIKTWKIVSVVTCFQCKKWHFYSGMHCFNCIFQTLGLVSLSPPALYNCLLLKPTWTPYSSQRRTPVLWCTLKCTPGRAQQCQSDIAYVIDIFMLSSESHSKCQLTFFWSGSPKWCHLPIFSLADVC